jgi:hypothetical protein
MSDNDAAKNSQVIALVNCDDDVCNTFQQLNTEGRQVIRFANGAELINEWLEQNISIVAIISQSEILAPGGVPLLETIKKKKLHNIPFFLVVTHLSLNLRK